jgi:hypothetical protein
MLIQRLAEYKEKLQVLRQIHSDKAGRYAISDTVLNYGTLIATIVITSVGFLGFENMKAIAVLFGSVLTREVYDAIFNIVVLFLLVFSVLNVALDCRGKAALHYAAITNITRLIVRVEGLITKGDSLRELEVEGVSDAYDRLIEILPPNTDKEYFSAKEHLLAKKAKIRQIEGKVR